MAAAHNGRVNVTRLLLDRGANISFTDNQESTSLHKAANFPDVACILLDRGANMNARNKDGKTPMVLFEESGKKAELMSKIEAFKRKKREDQAAAEAKRAEEERKEQDRIREAQLERERAAAAEAAARAELRREIEAQVRREMEQQQDRDQLLQTDGSIISPSAEAEIIRWLRGVEASTGGTIKKELFDKSAQIFFDEGVFKLEDIDVISDLLTFEYLQKCELPRNYARKLSEAAGRLMIQQQRDGKTAPPPPSPP